jgi:hypothetical protein
MKNDPKERQEEQPKLSIPQLTLIHARPYR